MAVRLRGAGGGGCAAMAPMRPPAHAFALAPSSLLLLLCALSPPDGGKVGDPGKGYLDGHEDGFVGNIAIVGYDGSYAKPICAGAPGVTIMNTSRIFSPKGQLTTDCGASFDVGAQYSPYTATMADDIIGFARAALSA